nr:hypothetical protein [Tanacetum cinerariifolium]
MELNKFIVNDDMIDYVLHKYGSNWQIHDAIANDILDDLLKKSERNSSVRKKVNIIEDLDVLQQRIEKVGKHLNKAKEKMDVNKEREKMLMETATSDKSSDHNHFQATSNERFDHNPFQATFDDTLKSSFEDTYSSDSTWEQKKASKGKPGFKSTQAKKAFSGKQGLSSVKAKKAIIPSAILQWCDDLSSDEKRIVYKGRPGSSSKYTAIAKPKKPKSWSKHLAPTTPRTWSTYITLVVLTKRSPPVTNCVLGLAAVNTWQQILNKEFRIKKPKKKLEEVQM